MPAPGPYILTAKLGEGGMAEVFKAVKTGPEGFEKPIALKRILPFWADREEFIRMLSAEARLHARLDHPNIVQILDFFRQDGHYMIALEYVPGKNVRRMTEDARAAGIPLPWQGALHLICETLQGLDFAHKRNGAEGPLGIIHRDVSPQNILVSYDGLVKLSDFGIARADIGREETRSGVLKGKQRYLAPEQVAGRAIDRRTDIFSAAVVLYELLCGSHPFDAENEFQIMKRIETADFKPLREIRPDLPAAVCEAVEKALAVEPSGRFEDAEQFRRALLAAQDPVWLARGAEELKRWMSRVYPKPSDREEPAIERTPVLPRLIHPSVSLISSAAAEPPARRTNRRYLSALAAVAVAGAAIWILKIKRHEPAAVPTAAPAATATAVPTTPAPKAAQAFGYLNFHGPRGADVFVNGRKIGQLPLAPYRVVPGDYIVLFKTPKGATSVSRASVVKNGTVSVKWTKSQRTSKRK